MIRSMMPLASICILASLAAPLAGAGGQAEPPTPAGSRRGQHPSLVCSRRIGPQSLMHGERVSELVLLDAQTRARTTLSDGGFRFMPTASPDGTRIAYVKATSPAAFNLFEMDLDGRDVRQLTFLEQGIAHTPAYSPDGGSLLHTADGEVQLLDLTTLESRRLTYTTVGTTIERPGGEIIAVTPNSHHASFSPDGLEVVYASTQSGHVQVWKMKRDGSEPRQLTDGSHGERYPHANVPSFSLGTDTIVFWSGFEGNFGEVWSMDRDGAHKRQLTTTTDPGNSDDPFLSPDGSLVVFGRGAPGSDRGMYLLDVGTGEVRLLIADFQWCNWLPASPVAN